MKRLTLSQRLLISSGVLFAGFVACQLFYGAIGQRIEPDGTLREPFFLIPISVFLLLSSSASLAGAALARWRQDCKPEPFAPPQDTEKSMKKGLSPIPAY